jgi:hypothetical protein
MGLADAPQCAKRSDAADPDPDPDPQEAVPDHLRCGVFRPYEALGGPRKIRVMRRPEEWPVQEALSWASNATTGATCRAENRSLSTAVVRSSFRTVSRDIWVVAMGATALTARTV